LGYAISSELALWVDRERARHSTWYNYSAIRLPDPTRHGTFADVRELLP
jgi:starch synthase (maltosyl-transferring)